MRSLFCVASCCISCCIYFEIKCILLFLAVLCCLHCTKKSHACADLRKHGIFLWWRRRELNPTHKAEHSHFYGIVLHFVLHKKITCYRNATPIKQPHHYKPTKWLCRGKWMAGIRFQGKRYNLGRFDSFDEAVEARKKAEKEIFGNFLEWYEQNYKKKNPPLSEGDLY